MDTNPHIPDSLHESEIFKGLSNQHYSDLLKKGRSIKLRPKSILFHQGDPAEICVLVNRGRLKLTTLNEQGKEVIFRYISAGEFTAAVAVIPLILLSALNYHMTQSSIEAERLSRTARLVSNTRRTIFYFFDERRSALDFIVKVSSFESLNRLGALEQILKNLKNY